MPTAVVPIGVSDRPTAATIRRIVQLDRMIEVRSRRAPADIADRTRGIRPTGPIEIAPATASDPRATAPLRIDLTGKAIARPAVGRPAKVKDQVAIGVIGAGHRTIDPVMT